MRLSLQIQKLLGSGGAQCAASNEGAVLQPPRALKTWHAFKQSSGDANVVHDEVAYKG